MNASEAVPEPRNPEPQDSSQKKHEQKKQSRRYPQLDVLRGFALSGIVLINAPAILQVSLPEPEDSFFLLSELVGNLVQGKFFSTFGLVFGLSFAYYLTSAKLAGRPVIWGTLRRLAALGIFGTIHALFYSADVLRAYAMLGVILLALSFLPQWASRVAGALGIVLAATVSPAMGLALVGYWFASSGRFARWSTDVAVLVKLAVPALFVFVGAEIWGQLQPDEVMTSKMFSSVAGPILYSTVILILWNYFPRVLQMLYQPLGKLTLTHYLGATFLITATAAVFGFPQGEGSWIMAILLGVGIVVFQWIFSLIWLRFFTQGPLEWIWRSVTWLSMPPILRSSTRESR